MKTLRILIASCLALASCTTAFAQTPVKLSALPELTTAAEGDLLAITDISDTSSAASGTTKKITIGNLSLALTGTATGLTAGRVVTGGVTSAMILDGTIVNADINGAAAIANAKLANSSITIAGTVVSLGGSISATSILNTFGLTRGSVLYRGSSGWAALTPGAAGTVLQSNGAGADPTFAAAGAATFITVFNTAARYALSAQAGTIVHETSTHHRWLACDVSKLTADAGWQDLGVERGPVFYRQGNVTANPDLWMIGGGAGDFVGTLAATQVFLTADTVQITITDSALNGLFDASAFGALTTLEVNGVATPMPPIPAATLIFLRFQNCASLVNALNLALCPGVKTVDLSGNAHDETAINAMLVALDANGATEGIVNLSGGTNAAPTGAGASAAAALTGKGWTVTTN